MQMALKLRKLKSSDSFVRKMAECLNSASTLLKDTVHQIDDELKSEEKVICSQEAKTEMLKKYILKIAS